MYGLLQNGKVGSMQNYELNQEDIIKFKVTLENLKKDSEELKKDLKVIKESLYDPDNGLYFRLLKLSNESDKHKNIFSFFEKMLWLLVGAGITAGIKFFIG